MLTLTILQLLFWVLVGLISVLYIYNKHFKRLVKSTAKKSLSINDINDQDLGFKIVTDPTTRQTSMLVQSQSVCQQIFFNNRTTRESDLGLGSLFDRWLGRCLGSLNSEDPKWGKTKRIFRPLFACNISSDSSNNLVSDLIKDWDNYLTEMYETMKSTNQPVSIHEVVNNLPLQFILRMVFGKDFVNNNSGTFEMLRKDAETLMFNVFNNKYAKSSYYEYLPTYLNKAVGRFKNNWDTILVEATTDTTVEKQGIYYDLLQNYTKVGDLDWEIFSQTLVEIIYANQDVAVPSMKWLMVHYAIHQYDPLVNPDDPDDTTDPCDYIEEVGRMSPIFPTSMPKIITGDIIINGVIIPEGTPFVMDFVELGKSKDWNMDDLDQFRPSRFKEVGDRNKFVNRFGHGGRKCPGQKLANQLFLDVINYMRGKWTLVPKKMCEVSDVPLDPKKAFLSPVMDVWIVPKGLVVSSLIGTGMKKVYYNCSPISDMEDGAFLAVSVNDKSPYLEDNSMAKNIVSYFMERSIANNNKFPTIIYICDEIAHFNIEAFDRCSRKKANEKAEEMGNKIAEVFEECVRELGATDYVRVCRWKDDENIESKEFKELVGRLESIEWLNYRVDTLAKKFLSYRGQDKVNKSYGKKLELAKKYIFHEIPVLICGIVVDGVHYRLLHYSGSQMHLGKFVQDEDSLYNLINDVYKDESVVDMVVSKSRGGCPKIEGFVGIEF